MRCGHSVRIRRRAERAQEGERADDLGEAQKLLLVGRGRRLRGGAAAACWRLARLPAGRPRLRGAAPPLGLGVWGAAGADIAAAAAGSGGRVLRRGRAPNRRSKKLCASGPGGTSHAAKRQATAPAEIARRRIMRRLARIAKASARTAGEARRRRNSCRSRPPSPTGCPSLPVPSAARLRPSAPHGRRSRCEALHGLRRPVQSLRPARRSPMSSRLDPDLLHRVPAGPPRRASRRARPARRAAKKAPPSGGRPRAASSTLPVPEDGDRGPEDGSQRGRDGRPECATSGLRRAARH